MRLAVVVLGVVATVFLLCVLAALVIEVGLRPYSRRKHWAKVRDRHEQRELALIGEDAVEGESGPPTYDVQRELLIGGGRFPGSLRNMSGD